MENPMKSPNVCRLSGLCVSACFVLLYTFIQETQAVFVILTVQGSGYFHGVASVSREASSDMVSEFGQPELTNAYFITWIRR